MDAARLRWPRRVEVVAGLQTCMVMSGSTSDRFGGKALRPDEALVDG